MDQQFCLKWNNHQSAFMSLLNDLLFSEKLVDVFLMAEDEVIGAHKIVLSACSSYFEKIFTRCSDKNLFIMLNDISYSNLKCLMNYMYFGEVNVTQDQLPSLIKAAENLKIKGLSGVERESCENDTIDWPGREEIPTKSERKSSSKLKVPNTESDSHLEIDWQEHDSEMDIPAFKSTVFPNYNKQTASVETMVKSEDVADTGQSSLAVKQEFPIETSLHSSNSDNDGNDSSSHPVDDQSISEINSMKSHMKNYEDLSQYYKVLSYPGGPRYVCLSCNRHYKHKVLVVRHLRYECGNKRTFQCPICLKMFSHRFNLIAHERRVHLQASGFEMPPESSSVNCNMVS